MQAIATDWIRRFKGGQIVEGDQHMWDTVLAKELF